jgi:hypothetical protein
MEIIHDLSRPGARPASKLTSGRLRSFVPSSVLFAAGALVWGCTVYDSGLLPASGGQSGSGGTSTGGSQGGEGNGAGNGTLPSAGKTPAGGTEGVGEGGAPGTSSGGAGAVPSEGGTGNEAGEDSTGGVAGSGGGGTAGASGQGGSGGTGGSTPAVVCADQPLSDKTTWVATASSFSEGSGVETDGLYNPPMHMTDGKFGERWSSGKSQMGDEWIQIDFGVVVNLSNVTLNVNNDTADYPRKYALRVSNKNEDFAAPVRASGDGMPGNLVVSLASPVSGRYLTVRQTGVNEPDVTSWWTIAEVLVTCSN